MLSPAQWGQIATVGVIVGACLVLAVRKVDREDPYRTHEWEEAEDGDAYPKILADDEDLHDAA